jgi:hypothetical protein
MIGWRIHCLNRVPINSTLFIVASEPQRRCDSEILPPQLLQSCLRLCVGLRPGYLSYTVVGLALWPQ